MGDWLPEDHLACFVSDVVDQLDLSAICEVYEKELCGQPPYNPRMMAKLLVDGYCVGVYSARNIQRWLVEDVAFRALAAGNEPDFRTIADFRKINLQALEGLFEQVLKIVLETGTMKLGRVALDGTKVKAHASKRKAMSCDRKQSWLTVDIVRRRICKSWNRRKIRIVAWKRTLPPGASSTASGRCVCADRCRRMLHGSSG